MKCSEGGENSRSAPKTSEVAALATPAIASQLRGGPLPAGMAVSKRKRRGAAAGNMA